MQPTSPAEFQASETGGLPDPAWVTPDTLVVALPMPQNSVPYTLCYVLVDSVGRGHVLDPGVGDPHNLAVLFEAMRSSGVETVASVASTHLHPDHLGLVDRIRAETGARSAMGAVEWDALVALRDHPHGPEEAFARWGVPRGEQPELPPSRDSGLEGVEPPDVLVADGDLLDIPGRSIRAVVTPGHTAGHLCLRDETQGLFFSGDHVLPTVFPGLGLGGRTTDSPIGEYLAQLTRVAAFDADEVCPGHGYRFRGLADRCERTRAHHLKRSAEVAALLADCADASVWRIASMVRWTAGWDNLSGFLRYSALAQTEMHVQHLLSDGAAKNS